MTIELVLQRIFDDKETSQGYMLEVTPNRKLHGFTVEDQAQKVKVSGETRIPRNRYELKLNKWTDPSGQPSPLTQKYRAKYLWFSWHIEITGIPGFAGVYIHIGNNDKHTDGCVLLGDNAKALNEGLVKGEEPLSESVESFKRFYEYIKPALEKGEKVYLTVADEVW